MQQIITRTIAAAMLVSLTACVTMRMEAPQGSIDNLQLIRAGKPAPVAVGSFVLKAGKPAAIDRSLSVRGNGIKPPDGSFARYLGETLKAELQSAGAYQADAPVVISGELTDNAVDGSGTQTGTARLAARFKVQKAGKLVYDRELAVDARWKSSFVGIEAVPTAMNEHAGLFPKLIGKLLADPAFIAATRGGWAASQPA